MLTFFSKLISTNSQAFFLCQFTMKAFNVFSRSVADEAALPHTGKDVRHVYASNMTSRPGTFRPGQVGFTIVIPNRP